MWLWKRVKCIPSPPGVEPGIFWSVVRRVIHCATGPYLSTTWLSNICILICFAVIKTSVIAFAILGSMCEADRVRNLYISSIYLKDFGEYIWLSMLFCFTNLLSALLNCLNCRQTKRHLVLIFKIHSISFREKTFWKTKFWTLPTSSARRFPCSSPMSE